MTKCKYCGKEIGKDDSLVYCSYGYFCRSKHLTLFLNEKKDKKSKLTRLFDKNDELSIYNAIITFLIAILGIVGFTFWLIRGGFPNKFLPFIKC